MGSGRGSRGCGGGGGVAKHLVDLLQTSFEPDFLIEEVLAELGELSKWIYFHERSVYLWFNRMMCSSP
jgi:hypothetical protein